jgi:hypothetical protein
MAIIPVRKAASAARANDKLTETREISPYVWVHPDEER